MSRMVVSKLDVDVLVQLALLGPVEATDWPPLIEDPDGFGQTLWSASYDAAAHPEDDGTVPSYTFEPLPVIVSAIEGVKQCGFYRYQVGDEDAEVWSDPAGAVLHQLEQELIARLPGWEDAPWGWTGGDLSARADRREPLADAAARKDERVTSWQETWAAAGFELTVYPLTEAMSNRFSDPRDLLAQGFWAPRGFIGSPVEVDLCATEEYRPGSLPRPAPRSAAAARGGHPPVPVRHHGCLHDGLAPATGGPGSHDRRPDGPFRRAGPALVEPGAATARARRRDPGHGCASGVAIGWESYERAICARTPTELETLVAMLRDDDVREKVAAVDTRQHTVLMLRGVVDLHAVTSVRVRGGGRQLLR